MEADQFVGILFAARTLAHIEHLKTRNYARHVALGDFYGAVGDLADTFAEQYQGRYKKLLDVPVITSSRKTDVVRLLQSHVDWIESNRFKVCDKTETALQNVIDEVVGLYQSTIYKLVFLS